MFYHTNDKYKTAIPIFNRRPRNMSRGGYVKGDIKIATPEEDTILTLLEDNQLVVPKIVVPKLNNFLKVNDITGPIQRDKNKLDRVIVHPDEIIVHKSKAKKVEDYLKNNYGIVLPYNLSPLNA
jgi:hypothetical protein